MWIGLVIGSLFAVATWSRAFPRRHEPEPPNSRLKGPVSALLIVACAVLAFVGPWPVVWAALALWGSVQLGFVLAGRNPWWMQGWRELRAMERLPDRARS